MIHFVYHGILKFQSPSNTRFGIINSPSMGLRFTPIFGGYAMMTALFVGAWLGKVERDPEIGELDFEGE